MKPEHKSILIMLFPYSNPVYNLKLEASQEDEAWKTYWDGQELSEGLRLEFEVSLGIW